MMPERITSRSNARVRALRTVLQARRGEQAGIEGFHLLREAIASGLTLNTVFLRDDQAAMIDQLPASAIGEVVLLSREAFDSASATEHAQGVAAVLDRPTIPYAPRTGDLLLVADGLQDPGNLGTLIRSAEAFGAAAVALTPNTVDPWNGKCLRAAAGAVFRLPLPSWSNDLLADLHAVNASLYAAVAHGGDAAHVADLSGTVVLAIGNEAAGVSPELLKAADKHITIATTGPTESLNAAVAGSLLLYEAARQRVGQLA